MAEVAGRVVLPMFKARGKPFVLVFWSRDPDGSQHSKGDSLNTVGDDWLSQLHIDNFVNAVRTGAKLSAPIEDGAKTGILCHLGTISQQVGRKLTIDPKTGRILNDAEASRLWSREYDPRWKPVV